MLSVTILRRRCRDDDNCSLPRRRRLFYTLKALVCLVLRRWRPGSSCYEDQLDCAPVVVAIEGYQPTQHFEFGSGADWDETAVGWGVGRDWHLHSYGNGWP